MHGLLTNTNARHARLEKMWRSPIPTVQKVAASSPSFFSEVSRDAASSPSASQALLSDLPALQKTPYFSLQSGLVPLPPAPGGPPERRLKNGGEGR